MVEEETPQQGEDDKPILRKIFFLMVLVVIVLVVWVRMDLSTMSITLSKRVSTLEEVVFPVINVEEDPILGKLDAPVSIMIFSDFLEDSSYKFYNEIYVPLIVDYVQEEKARLIFKNFPSDDNNSIKLALIGECFYQQKKFWTYYTGLFKIFDLNITQKEEAIAKFITEGNLDKIEFDKCTNSSDSTIALITDLKDASRLDISYPTIFINQKKVRQYRPYEDFKLIIEEELENEES